MGEGTRFIGDVEVHPAAEMFPEMQGDSFEHLKQSIAAHGIRVPLTFFDGKLLDGRNRLRAYIALGLPLARLPREGLLPTADPYAFAWDRNCERLDYTPSQKAAIALKIADASGALARARAEAEAAANAARAEKAKEQHKVSNPRQGEKSGPGPREPAPKKSGPRAEASALADKAHVSVSTARRVLDLKAHDPAAFERLATTGELPKPPPSEPKPAPQAATLTPAQRLSDAIDRIEEEMQSDDFAVDPGDARSAAGRLEVLASTLRAYAKSRAA